MMRHSHYTSTHPDVPVLLADGAQPAPVWDSWSHGALTIFDDADGNTWLIPVCCGPAAPHPFPQPFLEWTHNAHTHRWELHITDAQTVVGAVACESIVRFGGDLGPLHGHFVRSGWPELPEAARNGCPNGEGFYPLSAAGVLEEEER